MNNQGYGFQWTKVIFGLVVIAISFPSSLLAQQGKMYWSDDESGFEHIRRANLDGSGIEDVVTGLTQPWGIAVDPADSTIYWIERVAGAIYRANLDGSDVDTLVTGLSLPRALVLDATGGKLYWTAPGAGVIQRSNLDGSDVDTLVTGLSSPFDLKVDATGGKLYWTDHDLGHIRRANLDGSGVETLISGLGNPWGLEIDVAGEMLYWTDNEPSLDHIQRANFDGSGLDTLVAGLGAPVGLALDIENEKIYWTDIESGFEHIRRANLDGSGVETLISGSGSPDYLVVVPSLSPPQASKIELALDNVSGQRGSTASVPLTLANPLTSPVGAIQFEVILGDTSLVQFEQFMNGIEHLGFDAAIETHHDTTIVVIHPSLDPEIADTVIPPGTTALGAFTYSIDLAAPISHVIPLNFRASVISDTLGMALPDTTIDGSITVEALRGDLTADGVIDVRDVILLVRILLGKDPAPEPGTPEFFAADGNGDGAINVVDVVYQINVILRRVTKPIADGPTQPVIVSLNELQTQPSGQQVIPITMQADGILAALQIAITFDPSQVQMGIPQLISRAVDMTMDSHMRDGMLRIVVYNMTGEGIAPGNGPVLLIPVVAIGKEAVTPTVTLSEVIVANRQAQAVAVKIGENIIKVSTSPTTFKLDANRPNPFNPATQIAYDVPQAAHIRLTVYNLLGQEVTRLVDEIKTPGRYSVIWNGRNRQGLSVASGVYLYRLTTGTGFSRTRRMTLLK